MIPNTARPEIRFFDHSKIFPGLAKNLFWFNKSFFGSKGFFTVQISPDSQKTFCSKTFLVEMVIFGSKMGNFDSCWVILATFWAQRFFGSKGFFWFS